MADLTDFNKSLSDLSDEELTEKLREIRLARRQPTPAAKKPTKSKAKEPKIDVGGLSPDLAAKLLKQLGES